MILTARRGGRGNRIPEFLNDNPELAPSYPRGKIIIKYQDKILIKKFLTETQKI